MASSSTTDRSLLQRVEPELVGRRRELQVVVAALAAGRHVLLEGPPGTGKSTLLSALLGQPGPNVRVAGTLEHRGGIGFLPQVPVAGGLGLDPIGLSHVLAARGLAECVTFSFLDRETAARFGATPEALGLANPIAADLDQMRPTPLATLCLAAARNAARGHGDLGLFEIGPAFRANGEIAMAAGLRTGATALSWIEPSRRVDAFDAKADAFALLEALGAPMEALTVTADAPSQYHPGRSGTIRQGPKQALGAFGALHPALCTALHLPAGTVGFEIDLHALSEPKRRRRAAPDLPQFQPVRRDFAFVADRDTPAEKLLRAAKGAERALIADVALFDRYEGEHLPDGKVSLAVAVTLQPRERSLTDQEIEAVAAKIVAAVTKATGATLRGG